MNCKPGDLAVTTFAKIPGNAGRLVKVVRFQNNDPDLGPRWWIHSLGSAMTASGGDQRFEGAFPDKYLRPVSGLPETETTDEQIKEPA
jgi:hypothetical protein